MKKLLILCLLFTPLFLFAHASQPSWEEQINTAADELMITHDQLNPLFWTNEQLDPLIRERVLTWVNKRFKQLSALIPGVRLVDVYFLGSMANYNYTAHSDLDFHLIVDLKDISYDKKLANNHMIIFSQFWTTDYQKINLNLYNYPVELLAFEQDNALTKKDNPTYSLFTNTWIVKPEHKTISFSKDKLIQVINKYHDEHQKITTEYENNPSPQNCYAIGKLYGELKARRKEIFDNDPDGQYALENVAFKVLRNTGEIDEMLLQYLSCQFNQNIDSIVK